MKFDSVGTEMQKGKNALKRSCLSAQHIDRLTGPQRFSDTLRNFGAYFSAHLPDAGVTVRL